MLSPFAIHHLLRYFDSIDKSVSRLTVARRPKDEPQLTDLLIDLFDEQEQQRYALDYGLTTLRETLRQADEPIGVNLSLETHEHPTEYENLVSQADIGLIIKYENHYEPNLSGQRSWLLQAKRSYPKEKSPPKYEVTSRFEAKAPQQHLRIEKLVGFIGEDSFRYLLYCPRPEDVHDELRLELSYYRGKALSGHIYDYAYGQELRDDVRNGGRTTAAGVFVAKHSNLPKNLGEVHNNIMNTVMPLSWFIIQHVPYAGSLNSDFWEDSESLLSNEPENDIVAMIVRGDRDVVDVIAEHLGQEEAWNGKWLVPATLTITISAGTQNVRDRARWERDRQ